MFDVSIGIAISGKSASDTFGLEGISSGFSVSSCI